MKFGRMEKIGTVCQEIVIKKMLAHHNGAPKLLCHCGKKTIATG
jgi:hypothetical protein